MKKTSSNKAISAVCLMGPTASGKTGLAVELARQYPFEIISVDSALVYRGMDIGTAKPSRELLAEIPHHLVNIRDPAEAYSAADFRSDALRLAEEIAQRNKIPLFVGGTMLYFKALKDGLANLPPADAAIRVQISEWAEKEGWPAVHRRLLEVDPISAARIHPNDSQRLQRALEVFEVSGKSMSDWRALQVNEDACPLKLVEIALIPENRAKLHEAIALRFKQMLDEGLVEEVGRLYARKDLHGGMASMKAVGYRQVWAYHAGDMRYEEMSDKAVIATRQLAKRQFTWLRAWRNLEKVVNSEVSGALKIIQASSILE